MAAAAQQQQAAAAVPDEPTLGQEQGHKGYSNNTCADEEGGQQATSALKPLGQVRV